MRRLPHILILGFIAVCVAYPLLTRQTQPAPPPPAPAADAAANPAPANVSTPARIQHAVFEDAGSRTHIAELGSMEAEAKKRDRGAARTYEVRTELQALRHEAWNLVISTNWDAYQTLRQKAAEAHNHQTPCTICDGGGYLRYCVLCRDSRGKCVTCKGTGTVGLGEYCPNCLGKGKCYLCFGSGRMPCLFCEDGTVQTKLEPPPREMPIKCPAPTEVQAMAAKEEKVRQSQVLNTVSHWIEDTPTVQQAIEEERVQAAANAPPTFWQRTGEQVLLLTMCGLVGLLVRYTLRRHKEEAEIRALAGKYLSDGREAARVKVPNYFELPSLPHDPNAEREDVAVSEAEDEAQQQLKERLAEFFAKVPGQLLDLVRVLQELGRTDDPAQRQGVLARMHGMVTELKNESDCWDLRPVWQMTSALELLLKRLADRPKEATLSTIRTVATAVDLLSDLCVPGVRPDLIINPPISVLAVDDDPLCVRAVVFALQKASMTPQVAGDGAKAVALCADNYYDVIFMDIQMPTMDGLTACEQLHKTKKNETTPVVFVTVQSDFQTRAQSTLKGGTELIAKPFLMFEITVKAITFAMRKRLDLAESCRRATMLGLSAAGVDAAPPDVAPAVNSQEPVPA